MNIQPKDNLRHKLFAVSPCPTVSQAVLKASVLGFVVITSVSSFICSGFYFHLQINMEEKTMTILCPQPQISHKVLIWTNITYIDDELHRSA